MNKFITQCLLGCLTLSSTLAMAEAPSPCYWSGQYTKCLPTNGIYLSNLRALYLGTDDETHYVKLIAPASMSVNEVLTLPSAIGSAGQAMVLDGSLNFTWATPLTNATLTSALESYVPIKAPATAASTANVASLSGTPTIDGVSFAFGGRVLLKNQTDDTQNGLYDIDPFGVWTRTQYAGATVLATDNTVTLVDPGGTVNGSTAWMSLPDSGTGGATFVQIPTTGTNAPLAASLALTTNASGQVAASTTTATELGYVHNVTSAIQTQLGTKITNPMTTAGDVIYGGASGAPTRLAAGTSTQLFHSGTTPSWSAVSLAADVTGTLPIGNGGTGQTTKAAAFDALSPMTTAGDIVYGGTAGTGTRLGIGAATTVLHGGASAPAYSQIVDADVSSSAAIAGSKLAAASASVAGAVSTGAQTFAGAKTLQDGLVVGSGATMTAFDSTAATGLTVVAQSGTGSVSSTSGYYFAQEFTVGGVKYVSLTCSYTFTLSVANTLTVLRLSSAIASGWRPAAKVSSSPVVGVGGVGTAAPILALTVDTSGNMDLNGFVTVDGTTGTARTIDTGAGAYADLKITITYKI